MLRFINSTLCKEQIENEDSMIPILDNDDNTLEVTYFNVCFLLHLTMNA